MEKVEPSDDQLLYVFLAWYSIFRANQGTVLLLTSMLPRPSLLNSLSNPARVQPRPNPLGLVSRSAKRERTSHTLLLA